MIRRPDLIEQFTELVVGADDPKHLAERTLEVVMSLTNGRCGAVFYRDGEQVRLFASRAIDQSALDAVQWVWTEKQQSLLRGETYYLPERAAETRLPSSGPTDAVSFAVVPVFEGERLVALLYVDSRDPHFCEKHDLERLQKFTRIVAKAVSTTTAAAPPVTTDTWQTYLERTPVEDMEREKLLLLLNRNEWNIARVARMMGVTRRTVYLRLRRYDIPRERIYKTHARRRAKVQAS
jgi:transcriptional regulator with GAF, ATPase, and Fis domain